MPNKKKQRNAFYFFMKEVQQDLRRVGQIVSMTKMPAIAHPKWTKLSPREQEKYAEMSKQYKEDWKVNQDGKMDSMGVPIAVTQKKETEAERKQDNMIKNINRPIEKMTTDEVIKHKFYIMHFNYACKSEANVYIPCEVGVVEYCIEDGVTGEEHHFIVPTDIPPAYKYECIQQTESVHGIPHENFEDASDDYNRIYESLKAFVKSDTRRSWKRVYTRPDFIEQTEKCLEFLYTKAGDEEEECFEVYDINILMLALRKHCQNPINYATAAEFLTKATFTYEANVGCKFHDEIDKMQECALGIPKRTAYLMSDHLIQPTLFNLEIKDGHFPLANEDTFVTMESSNFKVSDVIHKPDREERKPQQSYSKPLIKSVGHSAVFKSELEETYGVRYEKKAEATARAPEWRKPVRNEPLIKYNEVAKEAQPSFQMDQSDFPEIGASAFGRGLGLGRGAPRDNSTATSVSSSPNAWGKGNKNAEEDNLFTRIATSGIGRAKKK